VILASLLLSVLVGCDSLPSETHSGGLGAGVYSKVDAATISSVTMQGLDIVAQPSAVTAGGSTSLSTTVLKRSIKTDSRLRVRSTATTTIWTSTSADALVQITARAGSLSGMTYTPPATAGTYWVVARIVSESLVDSVAVNVAPAAQPVPVIVAIAPRQTSVVAGASQQFATTARWADAVSRSYTVSYSATGGTVASTGLYSAGTTSGTFRVIGACSCGGADTATVTVTAAVTLASLSISPRTVSMTAGATQQFGVVGTMSDGSAASLSAVSYTASGGSVTSGGAFTAPTTSGTYRVIVSTGGSALRDTAIVTVAVQNPSLTSLSITPASLTLSAGASQQLTVSATWSDGGTTLPSITYTASGGTVSASGLFTAPTTSGTYRVIVAHSAGALRDTSVVTVEANNGSQWSVLRDFNSGAAGTGTQRKSDGLDDAALKSLYSTERSFDGGMSARMTIDSGATGYGTWGGILGFPSQLTEGSDFWLQLYVYIPEDFVVLTPGNGSLKFLRVHTSTEQGGNGGYNDIQFRDDGRTDASFRMLKEGQAKWFYFGSPSSFAKGAWQRVTVHLKLSATLRSAGGNARVRVWQNGRLLTDEGEMQTLSRSTDRADALYLFTYWNGGAPRTQSLWVDKIQMANFQPAWASDLQGISP
jgi:hypothetical protein